MVPVFLLYLISFVLSYDKVSFEPLTSQTVLQSYSPNDCNSKCVLSQFIDKSNVNEQYYWLISSSLNIASTQWTIKSNIYSNSVNQYNNSENNITKQLPYNEATYLLSQNNSINEAFSSCTSIINNNTILCYTDYTNSSLSIYSIYCQIFTNQYLNGQWSSPILVAQNINDYAVPFQVICLNDSNGDYLIILHDDTSFYYTLLDSNGNIKQLQESFYSPNITYQGKMDINYISIESNPENNNILLLSWMNIANENSIVRQKNCYGLFVRYDEKKNEMIILNNHNEKINMNSDFWSAYHPVYIELNTENNCCFFMPYKELSELTNTAIGFISIFDDNFDHLYHHSSRNNDDIFFGDTSLNVNIEIIDLSPLKIEDVNDNLNYFAIIYLVENQYFNVTKFNISVYSLDYINNDRNKLNVIADDITLITTNGDVENFCVDLDKVNGILFISWIEYVHNDINICKQNSATIIAQTWKVTFS